MKFFKKNQISLNRVKKSLILSGLILISSFGIFSPVFAAAPVISAVSSSGVTSVSAVITWTTNINSNSLVDFGTTTSYGTTSGDAGASVTSHTVILSGLSPGTAYKYQVRSTDSLGNQTISNNGGAGYTFTTANAPTITDVHISLVDTNHAVITWNTSVNAYPYVAYGLSDSYGGLVGNESTLGTSHSVSIDGLTNGTTYYFKPRVKDVYGNFTYYSQDNIFTIGAPYLQSLTSTTANGTYGPSNIINVTATYQENLASGSTATVLLNTGVSVILNIINANKLSGSYAVGATGSGQNNPTLSVSSISSQYACNASSYCYGGVSLPIHNIEDGSNISIDTTAPFFSDVRPISGGWPPINSVTTNSDISYTLSEGLASGLITVSRTGGDADPNPSHTCTLTGTYLNWGVHSKFDTNNCQEGVMILVDGAIYTFTFSGQDTFGNSASSAVQTSVRFDTTAPILQSFASVTADGTYGAGSAINVTAVYNEAVEPGSTMSVIMNTGAVVSLTRDIASSLKLTGVYTVGNTTSGQNTLDLAVSSIVSQNTWDGAGNYNTGTTLPGINISDVSQIVVDTTIPSSGSAAFVTDPVNIANVSAVILSVDGEIGTTIYYSIDDTSGATAAVTGNIAMEADGSTNITGLSLSSLVDGTLTATVYLKKTNGEQSSAFQDTVTKDTVRPSSWSTQYYSDSALTQSLGDNPKLSAGTYYIRMGFSEALGSTPTITINAQGTANDVTADATTYVNATTYRYTRTIVSDPAANGTVLEDLLLSSATDVAGNTATSINPAYESIKAAYTDTIKPTVVGSITPNNAKVGTVSVSLVFNENMKTTVSPTVVLRKSNGTTLAVSGSYSSALNWSGTATISVGDSNGVATLEVSNPQDVAGNIMVSNNNVNTFNIDTISPVVSIIDGVDEGPVRTDTINIDASDSGTGIVSRFYGYSGDTVCNSGDVINNSFASNVNFSITGNHTDYLCTKVTDNAGNINYLFIGKLNVDNTAPTITSVTSNVDNGAYNAGDTIDIRVNFSENVTSVGSVAVTLETGATDHACNFSLLGGSFGTCNYVVQAGDISSDLTTISIVGNINDIAGNALTNFTPSSNLAANKNIVIDTVAPTVNIISPLVGNAVNNSTVILFSDTENTAPQCSFDNITWTNCISGTTTLSNVVGWDTLGEGSIALYLKDTDLAGNIGTDVEAGIIRDTNMPVVSNVTSDKNNGSYKVGELIHIIVTFSRNVTSTGSVIVTLETGNFDQACSFSIANALTGTCDYIVKAGDNSDDLNVNSVSGTIRDSVGNSLASTIPVINLADNKDIKIDTTSPTIASVTSDHSDGTFLLGERINIQVNFSEVVVSSGSATVNLDSGGSCSFIVTNSNIGVCDYYVGAGQNSLDLTTTSIVGSISDIAGNSMTNLTPVVNLGQSKNIKIDTTPAGPPTVTSVTSDKNNGAYTVGEVINLTANFSEIVTSAGNVTITLETGTVDRSCTFTINSATSGSCVYVVQEGDSSADLSVNTVTGVIRDVVNNALTNTIPGVNLNATKDIVIDTTAPLAPTITLTSPITDINKSAIAITGTGEVGTQIQYTIDDTNPLTTAKTGTGSVNGSGNISLSGINLTGLDGGTVTASMRLTDTAGNIGQAGTATATSQILLPIITSITSNKPDGRYPLGEIIDIRVNFSENVTSNGDVTVILETGDVDHSCSFLLNNTNIGICNYEVQIGDISNDLNVKFISGVISDQADNPMVNFGISSNLASNKDIAIDTVAPSAPTVTITDPINDSNKSNVTISGTGESNTNITYTINDQNDATAEKSGTSTVLSNGTINITGINLTGLDGGQLTVSVILTDSAGNASNPGTDTATSQIILPVISSINSVKENGAYREGVVVDVRVNFSENVTATGDVTVVLETGTVDRNCLFSITNSNVGSCDYTIQAGDTSSDLNATSISGNIYDQAGNPMVDFTLNSNLADNKNIVVDTTNVILNNFSSSSPDGVYGPNSTIGIIADYSENLLAGSVITLSLNTGATVTLSTITDGTKLTGIYQVGVPGSGEGTADLSVVSISSQNVCDLASNCLVTKSLPSINIASNSEISVDAISPAFLDVLPDNSTNIKNITDDSAISYTLSETMVSGKIVISRTAWAPDPDSPHTCTLSGEYLNIGSHEKFNVENCEFGAVTLASGAVYSFSFTGQDAYGNEAREMLKTGVSFGLDVDPPVISAISIENVTSSSAVVTWTTDEASNSLVDFGITTSYGNTRGDSFASETEHSVTIDGLTAGTTYVVRVRSSDATTNQAIDDNGGAGYQLTTLALPAISSVEVSEITFDSATISWETDAPVYSYVNYGKTITYGKAIGDDTSLTTSQSVSVENLESNTEYHYRVTMRDIFGNFSWGSDLTFVTNIDSTDKEGPIISEITVSDISGSGATINWKTDEPADSYVDYGITAEYGEKYGNDTLTVDHTVKLPSVLAINTLYHFRVISSDANGNKSISEDNSFVTNNATGGVGDGSGATTIDTTGGTTVDTTGSGSTPSSSNVSISGVKDSNITSSSVTINWKTSDPCNGMVRYGLTKEYGQVAGEDLTIDAIESFTSDHEIMITGLLSNTTYNYMVVSYDDTGNIFISSNGTFKTGALSSVSGVNVSNISLEAATVNWETGDPVTSELVYGETSNYGTSLKDDKVTNYHKIELTGLRTGQTYHFQVKGTNKDTGLVSSDDYVFATYPEPKVETYEVGDVSDSAAVIKWVTNVPTESSVDYSNLENPEDKGVQGVADIITDHEVKIIGLTQGTEYEIKVRGIDVNKNTFESDPFNLKTNIDLTPPMISRVSSKASLVNQKDDIIQAIIFWKTDEPATSQILFDVGMGKDELGQQSKADLNLTTNHLVVLTDLRPGTVYRFKVVSEDANKNNQQSDIFSLLTPRKEKSVFQLIISNFEQTFGWMQKNK